jgi:hypothetical protein
MMQEIPGEKPAEFHDHLCHRHHHLLVEVNAGRRQKFFCLLFLYLRK